MSLIDQHEWAKGFFKRETATRIERLPGSWKFTTKPVRTRTFTDGMDKGWVMTAVETVREAPAPIRYVVITGAPSWAEYWVGTLGALPSNREMIVVNRPGFCGSGPEECVSDIRVQAQVLAPLLDCAPGQNVVLIGHSYGAAIATLIADQNPGKVASLVLLSGYYGEFGITSRRLVTLGQKMWKLIPRDLRHAILEVTGQEPQLVHMREALNRVKAPIHVIHGDKDDYAPVETAQRLVEAVRPRRPISLHIVPGGNHHMHGGPPYVLPALLELCVPKKHAFAWPRFSLPRLSVENGGAQEEAAA